MLPAARSSSFFCPPGDLRVDAEAVLSTVFAEQVAAGESLYGEHCARCHGDSGQGSHNAPPLVGLQEGALPVDPPPGAKYRKTLVVPR